VHARDVGQNIAGPELGVAEQRQIFDGRRRRVGNAATGSGFALQPLDAIGGGRTGPDGGADVGKAEAGNVCVGEVASAFAKHSVDGAAHHRRIERSDANAKIGGMMQQRRQQLIASMADANDRDRRGEIPREFVVVRRPEILALFVNDPEDLGFRIESAHSRGDRLDVCGGGHFDDGSNALRAAQQRQVGAAQS
jgi:hypothetical protein